MNWEYTMVSEVGLRRKNNEDAVSWIVPEEEWKRQSMGILAVVSDGMGGYSNGERASALVLEHLEKHYYKSIRDPQEALKEAGHLTNLAVCSEAREIDRPMGATCTAIVLLPGHLFILHIGDSRCYIVQNSQIKQLTKDHTALAELNASPWALEGASTLMVNPHALTKAMGIQVESKFAGDVFQVPNDLKSGDKILLCSDGLTLHLSDKEILEHLESDNSLHEIKNKLVREILHRGAKDNFSFILIEYHA